MPALCDITVTWQINKLGEPGYTHGSRTYKGVNVAHTSHTRAFAQRQFNLLRRTLRGNDLLYVHWEMRYRDKRQMSLSGSLSATTHITKRRGIFED